jgi:hypothetical protein
MFGACRLDPAAPEVTKSIEQLSGLLESKEEKLVKSTLACFAALTDRFLRRDADTTPLLACGLPGMLLELLKTSSRIEDGVAGW